MLQIGMILHSKRSDALACAMRVVSYLKAHDVSVCAEDEFAADLGAMPFSQVNRVDVIVSLGGDGDTQAAIAGSIAEGFYGIPEELAQEALEHMDDTLKEYFWEYSGEVY